MNKIQRHDNVIVLTGKDRGKTGQVRKVVPGGKKIEEQRQAAAPRIIVTGVNIVNRHMKPRGQNKPGGIIQREAPISWANVALVCATRDAHRFPQQQHPQAPLLQEVQRERGLTHDGQLNEPRMKTRYKAEVVPQLVKEFSYANVMQAPRVDKVTLNIGLGEAVANGKALETASNDIATITGQHPVITRAKKSISNFKLREAMPIGVMGLPAQ